MKTTVRAMGSPKSEHIILRVSDWQAEVFQILISKTDFRRSDGSKYVSNILQMIKITIQDGLYAPSKALKRDSIDTP